MKLFEPIVKRSVLVHLNDRVAEDALRDGDDEHRVAFHCNGIRDWRQARTDRELRSLPTKYFR